MATKSSIGWLILVVALAIPEALFYQWQSRMEEASRQGGSVKVRIESKRFPPSDERTRLVNPMTAPPAESTPAPVPAEKAPAAAAPALPDSPAVGGALAAALVALPKPEPQPAPEVKAFAEWRDPTLSPYDIRRIEETKIDILARAEEAVAEKQRALRPKPKPSAQKSVVLQGIIYIDEGHHSAIVNNETVHEGEVIRTPAGLVQVLSITAQQVQFRHQGQRFYMSVNK